MNTTDMRFYSLDECLRVQMDGFTACESCSLFGTESCGGKAILLSKKNNKGYSIGDKGVVQNTEPESKRKHKKKK